MKVLVLTGNYPSKSSANSGIFIHQQVKALQQLGVECYVLMLHNWYPPLGLHRLLGIWQQGHRDKQRLFEEFEGVKIMHVPMFVKVPGRIFKENFYQRAARSLKKFISGHRELRDADWLYAHFLTDYGYIAALLKEQMRIKIAAIARGDDVHAWPEEHPSLVGHLRYLYQRADLMLANNRRLGNDALKWAGDHKPQFGVVYNGVDYAAFARQPMPPAAQNAMRAKYKLPEGKKVLLCVARAETLKGWNELLEAIAEERELLKDWVLLGLTDRHQSTQSMDVYAKTASLSLDGLVVLHPFVPYDEVKKLYWFTDAFILPSYNEGISNAVMEAMAAGSWVIASDVGGHAEIMDSGKSGFLIEPRSKEAIKAALVHPVHNYEAQKAEVSRQAVLKMQQLGNYTDNARKLIAQLQSH